MKDKEKGFTLVELLAVIVILAIVALISTPIVLNIIKTARAGSNKTSAQGYIRAINNSILVNELEPGSSRQDGVYNINELSVEVSGKLPEKGLVTIENRKVTDAKLCYDGYLITYDGANYGIKEEGCKSKSIVTLNVNGTKENKEINGLETSFNIENYTSGMTNISCNNGVILSQEENILKVENVFTDTVCNISNSLENTIDNLDNTENYILLIDNITVGSFKTFGNNTKLTIDMNGYSIDNTDYSFTIDTSSILTINNNSENESYITSNKTVISTNQNSHLNLSNVKLISTNDDNLSTICNKGILNVVNSYIEGPYGIGCNNSDDAYVLVDESIVKSTIYDAINFSSGYSSNGKILNSTLEGAKVALSSWSNGRIDIVNSRLYSASTETYTLRNDSKGIINVLNSSIIADNYTSVSNSVNGEINITDSEILGLNSGTNLYTWRSSVLNNGSINVSGNSVIRGNGTKDWTNAAIINNGVLNIFGHQATFDTNGDYKDGIYIETKTGQSIRNAGTLKVNGANISNINGYTSFTNVSDAAVAYMSNTYFYGNVRNEKSGTVNICSGIVNTDNVVLTNKTTGYIYYTSNVNLKSNNFEDNNDPTHILINEELVCQ